MPDTKECKLTCLGFLFEGGRVNVSMQLGVIGLGPVDATSLVSFILYNIYFYIYNIHIYFILL